MSTGRTSFSAQEGLGISISCQGMLKMCSIRQVLLPNPCWADANRTGSRGGMFCSFALLFCLLRRREEGEPAAVLNLPVTRQERKLRKKTKTRETTTRRKRAGNEGSTGGSGRTEWRKRACEGFTLGV